MTGMGQTMNRKAKWIAAGLCLTAFLLVLNGHEVVLAKDVQASDTKGSVSPKTKPGGPQPIPKELLAEFISAAKRTPEYQLCKAMELNDGLRETVEHWAKKLELKIKLSSNRFLPFYSPVRCAEKAFTVEDKAYNADPQFEKREVYYLLRLLPRGADQPSYEISAAQLMDLSFQYVLGVTILDPANAPVETFSVSEKSLLDVVEELSRTGKLDFSIRPDLLKNAYVSVSLHNKTPADCLEFAARAAGFRVTYGPLRRRHGGGPLEAQTRPSDAHAHWLKEALELHSDPDTEKPVKKPIEVLREEVFREGKKLLENRPVMVLEPIREAPQAAAK